MANLIIQDTFEPYYAGREDDAARRVKLHSQSVKSQRCLDGEIVLPKQTVLTAGDVRAQLRYLRRFIAH